MSLLQGVLRSTAGDPLALDVESDDDLVKSDDDLVNVVSLPGTPDRTRPSSPVRGASSRPLPGPLHISSRRDLLKALPTEINQRIFAYLPIRDLAKCALVSKKWNRSQTINYVWFQHYRRENFHDDSLPPGKWTKRESKQNWRVTHLKFGGDRSPTLNSFSRGSGYSSPSISGYQTPRELKEEQWKQEAHLAKPGKIEMRTMYKELGGRKSRGKTKLGSSGIRDKGGWEEVSGCSILTTMRPLISYDDITLPYQAESPSRSSPGPPPNKKRKGSNQKSKQPAAQRDHIRRTSDSHHLNGVSSLVADVSNAEIELTHEDIWDDSALIAAWNAATEEYEAYNGPEKGWKTEPVHKSPLWYNAPRSETNRPEPTAPISNHDQGSNGQEDSTPLDFDTFVPSHDPSLDVPLPLRPASAPQPNYISHFPPGSTGHIVDEDEAFTRALGAMYWGGYWTAVYHCQRSFAHNRLGDQENAELGGDYDNEIVEEANGEEVEDIETEFVLTQR